ncbi:hypothetical protein L9F63_014662, partial [Diploptera punctata]
FSNSLIIQEHILPTLISIYFHFLYILISLNRMGWLSVSKWDFGSQHYSNYTVLHQVDTHPLFFFFLTLNDFDLRGFCQILLAQKLLFFLSYWRDHADLHCFALPFLFYLPVFGSVLLHICFSFMCFGSLYSKNKSTVLPSCSKIYYDYLFLSSLDFHLELSSKTGSCTIFSIIEFRNFGIANIFSLGFDFIFLYLTFLTTRVKLIWCRFLINNYTSCTVSSILASIPSNLASSSLPVVGLPLVFLPSAFSRCHHLLRMSLFGLLRLLISSRLLSADWILAFLHLVQRRIMSADFFGGTMETSIASLFPFCDQGMICPTFPSSDRFGRVPERFVVFAKWLMNLAPNIPAVILLIRNLVLLFGATINSEDRQVSVHVDVYRYLIKNDFTILLQHACFFFSMLCVFFS